MRSQFDFVALIWNQNTFDEMRQITRWLTLLYIII